MKAVTVAPGTAESVRLEAADRPWLEQLVTRRVRPDKAGQALQREPGEIKVVMEFARP
jgi:hypothetical protein